MRVPGGYAFLCDPVDGIKEADTFTCVHCNTVIHVKPKARGDEYFCRQCMAPICERCAYYPCVPFLKKIEAMEARDRARRSYGG